MSFLFNDTATTEIYTLSLHDALPTSRSAPHCRPCAAPAARSRPSGCRSGRSGSCARSEEHTSELQSRENLVCRLLLEKKNTLLVVLPALAGTVATMQVDADRLAAAAP